MATKTFRFWIVIFVIFLLAGLTGMIFLKPRSQPAQSSNQQVTVLQASADTYVDSGEPNSNFGSQSTFKVQGASPERKGLLRFDFSSMPDYAVIESAILELKPVSQGGYTGGSIKEVDGNWVENTVNYADAPPEGALISSFPASTSAGNLSVDVTRVGLEGRAEIGFYITSEGSKSFEFYAHEKGSDFAPRLLITWSHNPALIPLTPSSKPPQTGLQTNPPQTTVTPIPVPSAIPPNNSGDPSVVAAGDMICDSLNPGPTYCQYKEVADAALAQNPTAVLVLGDECHLPSVECYNNYFKPTWGRMFSITYPISGNHDYLVPGAVNYYDYWNGVGVFSGKAGDRDKGYYSFDIGAWHVVALNSMCSQVGGCSPGSPQFSWLEQDLKDHPVKCTLAMYHIPSFSSGGRANNNMMDIYKLLYDNNVDIILNGHDHIYERFAPQDPKGALDNARGIRVFVVGTGGANHTFITAVEPNSQVRNADTFGVIKLTLHPESYDWMFVPVQGMTFTDSGSTQCH